MIFLGNIHSNIQVIAEQWESRLRDFLFKERKNKLRIQGGGAYRTYYDKMFGKVETSSLIDNEKEAIRETLIWFKDNFRRIILAGEKDLDEYSKKNVPEFMHKIMEKLYTDFTQHSDANGISNAHYFFRELNIRTCPYCNRHYTFSLNANDKENVKVAPEYDHFYNKKDYPLLAVSFYNLVPSCHSCNHAKGIRTVKINPYFSGFKRMFELQDKEGNRMPVDEIINQKKEGKIGFGKLEEERRAKDEQENINTFGLQGLYEMHDDYINEIVEKTIAYNPTVRQSLVDAFQAQAYSPQQVFDFVWGKYLTEAQYDKRPLSKLTRDILEQLGLLVGIDS